MTTIAAKYIEGVRHSDTPRTEKGETIQGGTLDDADAQLSPQGHFAAMQLGNALAERYADDIQSNDIVIVSAPLGRCVQTAEKIAFAFSHKYWERTRTFKEYAFNISENSREICHEKYEGMRGKLRDDKCTGWYEAKEKEYSEQGIVPPQDWRWQINPLSQGIIEKKDIPPNSSGKEPETIVAVYERGIKEFSILAEKYKEKRIILVSSGAFLWSLAYKLDASEKESKEPYPVYYGGKAGPLYPKTCSVSHFIRDEKGVFYFKGKEELVNASQKV